MDDGNRRQKERRKFREIMGLIRMDFGNWGDKVLTETGFFELQRGAHSG